MILPSDSLASVALGIAAALTYAVAAISSKGAARVARGALMAAWLAHGAMLVLTLFIEPPRFGFAPALSMTGWLALTIYGVESRMFPQLHAQRILSGLGAVVVLLALLFPGALLQADSPWLAVHLALGITSYGLFAAAVIHAWLMRRAETRMREAGVPDGGIPLLTLERLTFQFVLAGFVLLTATLLFGWLFGETLYGPGRAWRWDHKTVFSLLAWITFALLLLGRWRFGWRGRRAVRVLYTGSGLLLLGYAGSRFVLEVVLRRMA